ncbi:RES family NAD+ phosphorylase [Methylobacillus sp.]|uniref:RES family NAD+ phosphorylase n=1 Tax=Methylobacillus sp. TaxID=56818 RepID=UPI002FDF27EB
MLAWRIAKEKYALDRAGTGARIAGGRWNSEGIAVIYAGLSVAITAFEKLVHTGNPLPDDLVLVEIKLPDDSALYQTLNRNSLPKGWSAMPSSIEAARLGDQFVEAGQHMGLIVPSVIIPENQNIVINPQHPRFSEITFEILRPFTFDHRVRPE